MQNENVSIEALRIESILDRNTIPLFLQPLPKYNSKKTKLFKSYQNALKYISFLIDDNKINYGQITHINETVGLYVDEIEFHSPKNFELYIDEFKHVINRWKELSIAYQLFETTDNIDQFQRLENNIIYVKK